jgi:hypothetical protein
MTIYDLLILQFIAHLLADFTFQKETWANDKDIDGFSSKFLKWHILITLVLSLMLSFQWLFICASIVIAAIHWIIDGFKKELLEYKKTSNYTFFIDQSLHLLVIIGVTLMYSYLFKINPYIEIPIHTYRLLIIAGYLLCAKPANMIIKAIFQMYEISLADKEGAILNAGKLIGISERIITLTLILYGQFEAVGFIIAGKSILRFKETDTSKTEYVLIGTMLSFGIAIITGIGLLILKSKLF